MAQDGAEGQLASKLPQKLNIELMQTKWASLLNPLLINPALDCSILKNVSLALGVNSIDHKLGRALQGWSVCRLRASATIHDSQDTNQTPELTLVLNASAPVVVDLVVF